MKFRFDHAYSNDKNYSFQKKLSKAGFTLAELMVEHPGKAFCKFIYIGKANDNKLQYLEFVHMGKGEKWDGFARTLHPQVRNGN